MSHHSPHRVGLGHSTTDVVKFSPLGLASAASPIRSPSPLSYPQVFFSVGSRR